LLLVAWLGWRATHVERTTAADLPEKPVKFVTLGSSSDRDAWLWRLRVANLGIAVVALIGAIAPFATA
jgi:hypothetical protein